mgnify:CR=1 FL=1
MTFDALIFFNFEAGKRAQQAHEKLKSVAKEIGVDLHARRTQKTYRIENDRI